MVVAHLFDCLYNTGGGGGVLPFDVIVVSIRVLKDKTFCCIWGFFSGVKKSAFAVCLIFWFELHAWWLDWCQI